MDNKENRGYWMFRVSNKWGNKTNYCLENNLVYCGWNIGLSQNKTDEILKEYPWAKRMAIKFTYINEGDVIVMPLPNGIAVGIAGEKQYRKDLEWQDTISVEWKTKFYSKSNLTSAFNSRLKFRGTFNNLWAFSEDLEKLINSGFEDSNETYSKKKNESYEKSIDHIASHINSSKNIHFKDNEVEDFVRHLFELYFYGEKETTVTRGKIEHRTGGDFVMRGDNYNTLGVSIDFNIQVKGHEGKGDLWGISQVNRSQDENTKNILVTFAEITEDMERLAEKLAEKEGYNVTLLGHKDLAEMIYECFDDIHEKYLVKLGLFKSFSS